MIDKCCPKCGHKMGSDVAENEGPEGAEIEISMSPDMEAKKAVLGEVGGLDDSALASKLMDFLAKRKKPNEEV